MHACLAWSPTAPVKKSVLRRRKLKYTSKSLERDKLADNHKREKEKERKKERKRKKEKERERERSEKGRKICMHVYMYIYIYIYKQIDRELSLYLNLFPTHLLDAPVQLLSDSKKNSIKAFLGHSFQNMVSHAWCAITQ